MGSKVVASERRIWAFSKDKRQLDSAQGRCHMDYLRHQLGQGVARARPELSSSDQQALIDHLVEFIEKYHAESQSKPLRTGAPRPDAASHKGRSEVTGTPPESGAIGFVISCRPDGKITEVIQDSLGQGSRLSPDMDFTAIVSPFHSRKAARFLRSIQPDHALYDHALSVLGRSGMVRLFCSGFSVGPLIVVVATEEPLAMSIPEDLSRLAEKKPGRLGPVLKELAGWKTNQRNVPPAAAGDPPQAAEGPTSSEITARHSTSAGRRRLLELAAHDLRNPISGILAACQYLMEDATQALEPHQLLILYSIESSTRLALQLIQDMAEIPSIRLAKPQLDLRPTDLVAVVHQAVSAVRPLADAMKVKVQVRVREQIPTVTGDATRLSEALHGLLINAIGPSPAAGQIEIVVAVHSGEPTILMHREYAMAAGRSGTTLAGQSGSRSSHRKLTDIHAALLLARTRRIVEAHGGAMQLATPGKQDNSWTMTLPSAAGHPARKK